MSKEWYLLSSNTKPNSLGGYENEAFVEYKDDSFSETLETDIATTVLLYNYDLSQKRKIRCIIEGNTSDTLLKSMERIGLFEIGTVKAGMYIFYENSYWLITGYPGSNGIYEKVTMVLCQYLLKWQNANGDVCERWCNTVSASKYDVGENGNNVVVLSSNTFTVLLPGDDECLELDKKRVFIDKHKSNPRKVYKLTRNDDVLYEYGEDHGSILSFIADKTEFNPETDNPDLRLCDYFSSNNPPVPEIPSEDSKITATISGGFTLRLGCNKSWSVSFYKNSEPYDNVKFHWNIVDGDFLQTSINENKITLYFSDEDYVEQAVTLQVLNDKNDILAEMPITLVNEL